MELKPFDKVLVRDDNYAIWNIDLFQKYNPKLKYPYNCLTGVHKQCIPYKDNEYLLSTTTAPASKYDFKNGDIVIVWNNDSDKYIRVFKRKSKNLYTTYNNLSGSVEQWDNCIPSELNNKE